MHANVMFIFEFDFAKFADKHPFIFLYMVNCLFKMYLEHILNTFIQILHRK